MVSRPDGPNIIVHVLKHQRPNNNAEEKRRVCEPDSASFVRYTENEFDHEFIEVLRNACLKFVLRQQKTTLKAISAFIHEKGLSNVELKEEDISSIVKILVYDGELDEIVRPGADPLYIPAIMKQSSAVGAMEVPCGKCPVYKDCKPGGAINPQNCVYLDEWFGI